MCLVANCFMRRYHGVNAKVELSLCSKFLLTFSLVLSFRARSVVLLAEAQIA